MGVPNLDELLSILEFVVVEEGVGMARDETLILLCAATSGKGVVLFSVHGKSLLQSTFVLQELTSTRKH